MSHTEGKLSYAHRERADGTYSTELFDVNGKTVAEASWYSVKTETGYKTNREENARRLVACWNEHDDLVAERDELVKALRKVVEWNNKYPSSRVFSYSEIAQIAKEMDEISNEAAEILARYPTK